MGRPWNDDAEDYWFEQRYADLMHDEHTKGHPNSDSRNCDWCKGEESGQATAAH